MTRRIKIELPGVVTPSLNKLMRMHFRKRTALRNEYAWLMIAAGAKDEKYKAGWAEHRKVMITSYRKSLLDYDNLVGSCKILIDAMQEVGIIFLDSPDFLDLTINQVLEKKDQRTEIIIEWQDKEQPQPEQPKQ